MKLFLWMWVVVRCVCGRTQRAKQPEREQCFPFFLFSGCGCVVEVYGLLRMCVCVVDVCTICSPEY